MLECLKAIYSQTYPITSLTLIDNASTDGTEQALKDAGYFSRPSFDYRLMPQNLGCTGGFYEGINIARNSDWCWIMDDDTVPEADALEKLIDASTFAGDDASFFASCVYGPNGEPMNVPALDTRPAANGYSDWYRKLDDGMVKISSATFVSILLNVKAIDKCGLPCREYFIWGDDSEYTLRFTTHYGNAYLVGKSKACHKRALTQSLSIARETDKDRLKNYFYLYRNNLVNTIIYSGRKAALKFTINNVRAALKFITKPAGFRKCGIILHGLFSGWLCWRKFNRFIESQLHA